MYRVSRCENSRVLEWVFQRVNGEGGAAETPIGYVPAGASHHLTQDYGWWHVNDADEMFLRNDTPGCVRHEKGDTFSEVL